MAQTYSLKMIRNKLGETLAQVYTLQQHCVTLVCAS